MINFTSDSMRYQDGCFEILDQTALPLKESWVTVKTPEDMYNIIKTLKVRGASLIGLSAAAFMVKYAHEENPTQTKFVQVSEYLESARPTAVHLSLMLRDIRQVYTDTLEAKMVAKRFMEYYTEDLEACLAMASVGAELIKPGAQILTHCNTGSLIGPSIGSAIGVIRHANESGKKVFVYVDETRPLLQGARLTAWEMDKFAIPFTLICDNMAGYLMANNKVDFVITGADRIAANGDTANKIGTYSLAVLANYHKIPFYIAAPHTTFDFNTLTGKDIVVENRDAHEINHIVTGFGNFQIAHDNCNAFINPSFDVTPRELITAFITNRGLIGSDDKIEDIIKGNNSYIFTDK